MAKYFKLSQVEHIFRLKFKRVSIAELSCFCCSAYAWNLTSGGGYSKMPFEGKGSIEIAVGYVWVLKGGGTALRG